jgi:anthranilate 1,2-dioxygenase large subunit
MGLGFLTKFTLRQRSIDSSRNESFVGRVWSFVALEAEIPQPNDFKSTFVGATPIVVTRGADGTLAAWVNRCAHRGARVCRAARGNTKCHVCVYHQWSYDTRGELRGIPFRNGVQPPF